jgi:hypothetical protein
MNRWRSRLAELRTGAQETPSFVQNVQNVQNPLLGPTFEHFERFERRARAPSQTTEPRGAARCVDIQAEPTALEFAVVAPSDWFKRVAPPGEGEPAFDKSCSARRGLIEERRSVLLHFCAECGAWGAFGYGVNLCAGRLGRWYCAKHRPRNSVRLSR